VVEAGVGGGRGLGRAPEGAGPRRWRSLGELLLAGGWNGAGEERWARSLGRSLGTGGGASRRSDLSLQGSRRLSRFVALRPLSGLFATQRHQRAAFRSARSGRRGRGTTTLHQPRFLPPPVNRGAPKAHPGPRPGRGAGSAGRGRGRQQKQLLQRLPEHAPEGAGQNRERPGAGALLRRGDSSRGPPGLPEKSNKRSTREPAGLCSDCAWFLERSLQSRRGQRALWSICSVGPRHTPPPPERPAPRPPCPGPRSRAPPAAPRDRPPRAPPRPLTAAAPTPHPGSCRSRTASSGRRRS
jgi:hypothetical protein